MLSRQLKYNSNQSLQYCMSYHAGRSEFNSGNMVKKWKRPLCYLNLILFKPFILNPSLISSQKSKRHIIHY